MNARFKEIRKTLKLSQEAFGSKIGITGSSVSYIESGRSVLTEQNILAVCRVFDVNETWLRAGDGEMFVQMSRDEEIASFVGNILRDEGDSFKRRLISVLSRLDEADWEVLEKMVEKIKKD